MVESKFRESRFETTVNKLDCSDFSVYILCFQGNTIVDSIKKVLKIYVKGSTVEG